MPALFSLALFTQLLAAAVALIAWTSNTPASWTALGIYLLVASVLSALWMRLLGDARVKDQVAAAREHFLTERERIRVEAEQEKLGLVREAHAWVSREAARNASRANAKVAVIGAIAVAVGAALLSLQLFTLGTLTLSVAGGGMGGYLLRVGQERRQREREAARQLVVHPAEPDELDRTDPG